ncbi:MAG: 3'-5' exonuclease, partial [Chloroflexi bacterium]|nr:3'-5' exonuclease [Chloroflexota bacterium]
MTVIDLAKARAARIKRDRAPAQMLGYAVVDLETTGLRPGGYDRVVEIAIVRLDRELNETDAWTTLVDPQRDIGSRAIHGISALQVLEALLRAAGSIRTALAALRGLAHAVSPTHSPVPPIDRRTEFRGKTVCFTGESVCDF